MKLLRIYRNEEVKKDIYSNNLSDASLLNFAFIGTETSNNQNGEKCKYQTSKFVTCRELVCSIIQSSLFNKKYCNFDYKVDHNTLRLLFVASEHKFNKIKSKNNLFIAKRIINIMEEYMGLPFSIIASVKHNDIKEKVGAWLLTGSNEWLHAPQLISLFLLIFRLCFYHEEFAISVFKDEENLDIDNLINKLNDYIIKFNNKIETESVLFQAKKDIEYITIILPYLKLFLKNYKKIFEGKTEQYYPLETNKGFLGYGGIVTLFKKETGNPVLHKRFQHYVLDAKND